MGKLSLRNLDVRGKRVLMRVDFNTPLTKEGTVADASRIEAALPSILYVLDHGASLVLMSHLGRPKGKPDPEFSLAPCAKKLSQLLEKPVVLAPDCVGADVETAAKKLRAGEVLMLENVRFHLGEEESDKEPEFAKRLARLGDVYVNDAFGTAHRAHASTAAIARFFPGKAAMGFLMEKEIAALSYLLDRPSRPFFAILGGAKVATKAGAAKNLLPRLDALFLGGAMAYPFLKGQGISIGGSLFDPADVPAAQEIAAVARSRGVPLYLPVDLVIADLKEETAVRTVDAAKGIPAGWRGMDIGPKTIASWTRLLQPAKTVFWNGPLGVFETPRFAEGTRQIAETLAKMKAQTFAGGGDTLAAIEQTGCANSFFHLSTGGGASLEFLESGTLPGIEALSSFP